MKKLLMTASSWGHIEHFHLPYLRGFRANGWTVHVGCANPPMHHVDVDGLINLPFVKKMSALQNFSVAYQIRNQIQSEQYDLVICHTSLAAFFTRLAVVGLSNRPTIINMVHGYLFDDKTSFLKKTTYLSAERLMAPITDVVVTMNQWDTDCANKYKLGKRVIAVPGVGVDIPTYESVCFSPERRSALGLNIPEDAFVLIYAAEFSQRKNQQMLIRAMAHLPHHAHLVLLGNGALFEDCRALVTTMGLTQRVHFPGFVANVAEWYSVANVAVSASRGEGIPFNIMEAMASGLFVVVSDIKGHRDLVCSNEVGQLYPYDDISAFVAAVQQRMATTPKLEHRQCRRMAAMPYSLSEVSPQVYAAYGVSAAQTVHIGKE